MWKCCLQYGMLFVTASMCQASCKAPHRICLGRWIGQHCTKSPSFPAIAWPGHSSHIRGALSEQSQQSGLALHSPRPFGKNTLLPGTSASLRWYRGEMTLQSDRLGSWRQLIKMTFRPEFAGCLNRSCRMQRLFALLIRGMQTETSLTHDCPIFIIGWPDSGQKL